MADETRPLPCPTQYLDYALRALSRAQGLVKAQPWHQEAKAQVQQARTLFKESSQSIRDAAMAEGWREAQRWLVEIFELDAARKMDMMLREREVSRAKGGAKP